jgi:hypothetical protein
VRDDIERFISKQYPNSEQLRSALLQFASGYQQVMSPPASPEDAIDKTQQIFLSVECAAYVAPGSYADAVQNVEREILNTMLRLRTNAEFDETVGGHAFQFGAEPPGDAACRF